MCYNLAKGRWSFVPDIKDGVLVLYAVIGDRDISEPLVCKARDAMARAIGNESVRREKYLVWKLLERAVKEHTSLDFANLQFAKTDNGQWVCPDLYFSLSHTDGVICAAVAPHPVGVDIEKIRPVKEGMLYRFLTEREIEYMDSLPQEDREVFFFESWVKKESIFKLSGGDALMPRETETLDSTAKVTHVTIDGAEYLIAVASYDNNNCEIRFTEEI